MKLNRILFINLDRIGDVVRSTFLFRALRARYPHAYITCLSTTPSDVFLKNDPNIDEVFSMPHKETREIMDEGKTILHMSLPVFQLLEELKIHNFDLVINPFSEFGAMVVQYVKPQYVLGRALDKKGHFVVYGEETAKFFYLMSNMKGVRAENALSFSGMYARILKDIGVELSSSDQRPELFVSLKDREAADAFLLSEGVTKADVCVGMQVGAYVHEKMWPVEKFRVVAQRLQAEFGVKIILTGSRHEADDVIRSLCEGMETQPIVAAGKTSITESAAVIDQCDLFISNDTGPMHIAAALGVPIIAIFGMRRTVPEESRPWGEGNMVFAQPDIQDVSAEDILAASREKIKAIQKAI